MTDIPNRPIYGTAKDSEILINCTNYAAKSLWYWYNFYHNIAANAALFSASRR